MMLMRIVMRCSLLLCTLTVFCMQAQTIKVKPEKRTAIQAVLKKAKEQKAEIKETTYGALMDGRENIPEFKPWVNVKVTQIKFFENQPGVMLFHFQDRETLLKFHYAYSSRLNYRALSVIQGNSLISFTDVWDYEQLMPAFASGGALEIYQAIQYRNLDALKKMKDKGVDLKQPRFAVFNGLTVNIGSGQGQTYSDMNALHLAIHTGDAEMVAYLLEQGFDVNSTFSVFGESFSFRPFDETASKVSALKAIKDKGHTEVLKLLLKKGIDVNARDSEGRPAYFWLSDLFSVDVMKLVVEQGADLKLSTKQSGRNILFEYHDMETLDFLIQAGAEVNHEDIHGNIPISQYMHVMDRLEKLEAAGANLKHLNKTSQSLLFHVTGATEAEYLIKKGLDVNHQDHEGNTPFHRDFIRRGIVQVLLDHGADPMIKNKAGVDAATFLRESRNGSFEPVRAWMKENGKSLTLTQKAVKIITPEKRNSLDYMIQYQKATGAEFTEMTFGQVYEKVGIPAPKEMKPYLDVKIYSFIQRDRSKGGPFGGTMVKMPTVESIKVILKLLEKEGRSPVMMMIQGTTVLTSPISGQTALDFAWAFRTGGYPELYEAIRLGDLEQLKQLKAKGIDFAKARFVVPSMSMEPDEHGEVYVTDGSYSNMTALHLAAYFGQKEVLDKLLSQGFDLKTTCTYMCPPNEDYGVKGFYNNVSILSLPLVGQHFETAVHLINRGVDVNARDDGGYPVILDIASWGNLEILKAAIDKGADPKAIFTETGESILHMCYGGPEMVDYLLKLGLNPNAVDKRGVTPLMAIAGFDVKVAKSLVKAGADPKFLDNSNQHVLFHYVSPELVKYYLSLGVDPNHKNAAGQTALEVMEAEEADPAVLELLREAMKK